MKNLFSILIVLLFFVSCNSIVSKSPKPEQIESSRIFNDDLRHQLPILIQLRNDTAKDFDSYKSSVIIYYLVTENSIYTHVTDRDCLTTSFYEFVEKVGDRNYVIRVDTYSFKPERYFDFKDLSVIPRENDQPMICEDWHWIKAKYISINGKLKLEKISSFFDNLYSDEIFFDRKDLTFLIENDFLIFEPEPEPISKP